MLKFARNWTRRLLAEQASPPVLETKPEDRTVLIAGPDERAGLGEELSDRVRELWRRSDWPGLSLLSEHDISLHPEKGHIALLIAAAWLQIGNMAEVRRYALLSRSWGGEKKQIARLLIAGVHQTLGRAAAISGEETRALEHMRKSLIAPGSDESRARRQEPVGVAGKAALAGHIGFSNPVFIHSLWRSGSTYLFGAFRRSGLGYWAYQEPLHEAVLAMSDRPEMLMGLTADGMRHLRHPALDKPYYFELHAAHASWKGLLSKEAIFDDYFGGESGVAITRYFSALIRAAQGRPVIQECRTSGRIELLKKKLGGVHLFLWRNPWDQWWSFKVDSYFDVACQLILGAKGAPPVIALLRNECGYIEFHHTEIAEEYEYFRVRPLPPAKKYLVFFVLWCLALLEGMQHADLLVNVDGLSSSPDYRKETVASLEQLGIPGLNFDDCSSPQSYFDSDDVAFFHSVENIGFGLLARSGLSKEEIKRLRALRKQFQPRIGLPEADMFAGELARTRDVVFRLEEELHLRAQK
ncbi:hypothetical protein [Pseudoduganella rhizocola]|uniref:hypothetical protein n=1 Tax=Pseudoduganella rhizocola TaxID=3382643 RepID=UPI0038B58748